MELFGAAIQYSEAMSLYEYVQSNPTWHLDPMGLASDDSECYRTVEKSVAVKWNLAPSDPGRWGGGRNSIMRGIRVKIKKDKECCEFVGAPEVLRETKHRFGWSGNNSPGFPTGPTYYKDGECPCYTFSDSYTWRSALSKPPWLPWYVPWPFGNATQRTDITIVVCADGKMWATSVSKTSRPQAFFPKSTTNPPSPDDQTVDNPYKKRGSKR